MAHKKGKKAGQVRPFSFILRPNSSGEAIPQTYESKAMAKDILDFSFMPGENKDEIFILVKDAQGFALLRME